MDDIFSKLIQNVKANEFGLYEFYVSILFSLLMGLSCLFLYRLYFQRTHDRNDSLNLSFIIIAPSICAVFWAIQYSLPLSLGLLGALSFVRFRAPIKRAEDIGFILLVIALSLLSSVYRFAAASILLGIVFLIVKGKSILLDKNLTIFKTGNHLSLFVYTSSSDVAEIDAQVRQKLKSKFQDLKAGNITLMDVVQGDSGFNLRYAVYFRKFNDEFLSGIITLLNPLKDLIRVEVFLGQTI